MKKPTEKQLKFIDAKAQGLKHRQAAIIAGYAPNSCEVAASQLMQRPDIKSAIAKRKRELEKLGRVLPPLPGQEKEKPQLKDHYDDPLSLMQDVFNNPNIAFGMRFEAAKQAMPYCHARIGEQGKKEKKQEAANAANQGRFQPKTAPKLVSVK